MKIELKKIKMSQSFSLTRPSFPFLAEIRLKSYVLLENMFASVVF